MIIQTPIAAKRIERNTAIRKLYDKYIAIPGSMKTAVVNKIASELGISVTTVNRQVK